MAILTRSRPVYLDELVDIIIQAQKTIDSGNIASETMVEMTKDHIAKKYPNSKHWDTSKVTEAETTQEGGGVAIDIKGAGRARHDVTITPRRTQYLAIPIHQEAFGKKPADFDGLFRPWRVGGGDRVNQLAINEGGTLVRLFALAQKAFQPKDESILPTQEEYTEKVKSNWAEKFAELVATL